MFRGGEGASPAVVPASGPERGGTRVRGVRERLLALGERWYGVLLLLAVDLAIFAIAFYRLPITQGLFGYGDLPGFYTYGPPNAQWIGTLGVYPATVQIVSYAIGPALAQNLVFLSIFLAPSLALYALLIDLSPRRFLAVAISVAFGTILNPILTNDFLGGGFEFGLLMVFGFLAIRFLHRVYERREPEWNAAFGGAAFALALTQVGGASATEFEGAVMVGVFLLPLLLAAAWRIGLDSLRRAGAVVAIFLGVFLLVILPILIDSFVIAGQVTTNPTVLSSVDQFVFSNIHFTFRYYGASATLFAAPQSLPNVYWIPAVVPSWTILVAASTIAGVVVAAAAPHRHRTLALILISVEFGIAAFVWSVGAGLTVGVYTSIRPLDYLDDPFPFLIMQSMALPILLYLGTDWLLGPGRWIAVRARSWWPPVFSRVAPPGSRLARTWKVAGARHPEAAIAVAILVLAGATGYVFAGDLGTQLAHSPATEGAPITAPPGAVGLHAWFATLPPSDGGKVLVLPNTFPMYDKLWGFVPQSRLFTIPYAGNVLNSSYNASLYAAVLGLLGGGSKSAFAAEFGLAGGEYVGLLNVSVPITIVPSYVNQGATLTASYGSLERSLATSAEFVRVGGDSRFVVFRDRHYLPTGSSASAVRDYDSPDLSTVLGRADLLRNSDFSNVSQLFSWIRYPQPNVQPGTGGSADLTIDSGAPLNYTVLAGDVNLSQGRALLGSSIARAGSPAINFDGSLALLEYQVSARLAIPSGYNVDAFLYLYNTSDPQGLFTEYQSLSIGSFGSSSTSIRATVSIPSNASSARLYLYGHSLVDSGEAVLHISAPSVEAIVTTPDLLTNATAIASVEGLLTAAKITPPTSIALYPPLTVPSGGALASGLDPAGLYPAAAVGRVAGPSTLVIPLDPLVSQGSVTGGTAYLTGVSSAPGNVSISKTGSPATNSSVAEGPFFLSVALGTPSARAPALSFTFSGSVSLSEFGYFQSSTTTGVVNATTLALPLGFLRIAPTPSGVRLDWLPSLVPPVDLGGAALVVEFLPLATVAALLALRAGPRRRYPRSHLGAEARREEPVTVRVDQR